MSRPLWLTLYNQVLMPQAAWANFHLALRSILIFYCFSIIIINSLHAPQMHSPAYRICALPSRYSTFAVPQLSLKTISNGFTQVHSLMENWRGCDVQFVREKSERERWKFSNGNYAHVKLILILLWSLNRVKLPCVVVIII